MTLQLQAEAELLSAIVSEHGMGAVEYSLAVNPKHVDNVKIRAAIEELFGGASLIDAMHGANRETILEAMQTGTSPALIPELYRVVKNYWIDRQIEAAEMQRRTGSKGITGLYSLLESLGQIEADITEGRQAQAAKRFTDKLLTRRAMISSGLPALDRALNGGFEETEKVVIAARPSGGKTSLAVYLARLIAERGEGVGFWSVESPDDQIMRRAVASRCRIKLSDIKAARFTESERDEMIAYAHDIEKRGLAIYQASGETPEQVGMQMLLSPYRVCVVDHLQKFRGEDMRLAVGGASHIFANVANRKNKVVVMLSQLNRGADDDSEPKLSNLKESGDIEQDADIIIFIHNPRESETRGDDVVDVRLVIAKARDGGRGFVELKWNRPLCTFFELDTHHSDALVF